MTNESSKSFDMLPALYNELISQCYDLVCILSLDFCQEYGVG